MATTKPVQSVVRATGILELFQHEKSELGLKEIAELLDLNKSTAFGLTNTLYELGYLIQNSENQKYSLGPKILMLSNSLKTNNILINAAHPSLEWLTHKYHETTHSAVQSGSRIIYLDKVESQSSIFINTMMGVINYAYCTGVGKCLLSYLSEDELDQRLTFPLTPKTYNTITQRDQFLEELALNRERGYALDNEEIEIGLSCVAFPVFEAPDKPGFAFSVSGPTARLKEKIESTNLLADMQKISRELSQTIYGFNPQEF